MTLHCKKGQPFFRPKPRCHSSSFLPSCLSFPLSSSPRFPLQWDENSSQTRQHCAIFSVRFSYPSFLNRQGESLTQQDCFRIREQRLPHLLGSGNRELAVLSVSYRNVSVGLSLLNKVCNSIYFINMALL